MNYAKWMDLNELKKSLTPLNEKTKNEKSGVPMMYEENTIYTDTSERHSLIIATSGAGKTQSIILPQIKSAIKAEESIIINDMKGELFTHLNNFLNENGYKTININFNDPLSGNSYNPLTLPQKLYKSNKDKCIELLENIGYYFFSERSENNDPFWEKSTCNLFTGLALYLFETKENVSLQDIIKLAMDLNNENILSKLDKYSATYIYLSGILNAPAETKGSILSVFFQKLNLYICREDLSKLLSASDFNLEDIINHKIALFITNSGKSHIQNLISLLIQQIYETIDFLSINKKRINIILDEFESLYPIKDFSTILTFSRKLNIRFTLSVKSLLELKNNYGIENSELIKLNIGNMIYLYSQDIETLEKISKLCGRKLENDKEVALITPEELKLMKPFEAIILVPRMLPIRTKLLPDYKINWNL